MAMFRNKESVLSRNRRPSAADARLGRGTSPISGPLAPPRAEGRRKRDVPLSRGENPVGPRMVALSYLRRI